MQILVLKLEVAKDGPLLYVYIHGTLRSKRKKIRSENERLTRYRKKKKKDPGGESHLE